MSLMYIHQAQEVHFNLANIERLYLASQQNQSQNQNHILSALTKTVYENARYALESEAERLDRLIQGLTVSPEQTDTAKWIQYLELLSDPAVYTFIEADKHQTEKTFTNGAEAGVEDDDAVIIGLHTVRNLKSMSHKPVNKYILDKIEIATKNNNVHLIEFICDLIRLIRKKLVWTYLELVAWDEGMCRAAEFGHTDMVRAITQMNVADPAKTLQVACLKGSVDIVRFLLERPFQFDETLSMMNAIMGKHTEIVRLLLADPHGRIQPTGGTLTQACQYGSAEIVKLFLDDPNSEQYESLGAPYWETSSFLIETAISRDRSDIVKILLDDGRIEPAGALKCALQTGNTEIISLLLQDKRIDPTKIYISGFTHKKMIQHNLTHLLPLFGFVE